MVLFGVKLLLLNKDSKSHPCGCISIHVFYCWALFHYMHQSFSYWCTLGMFPGCSISVNKAASKHSCTSAFVDIRPRNRVSGSWGRCTNNLTEKLQIVLHSDCVIRHFRQQFMRILVNHHPCQHQVLPLLWFLVILVGFGQLKRVKQHLRVLNCIY